MLWLCTCVYLPLLCTLSKQANTCRFVTESKPDSCTHFSPSSNFLPIHPSSYKQHFLFHPHPSLPPLPLWLGNFARPWQVDGGKRKAEGRKRSLLAPFSHSRPLGTQIKKQHQKRAEMKAAKRLSDAKHLNRVLHIPIFPSIGDAIGSSADRPADKRRGS